jgi:hypothetical protein
MKEMKAQVKEEQEQRIKAREQKMRRMARNSSRGVGEIDQEKAFLMGLADLCPRCGDALEQYGEDEQREHLATCNDPWKHKRHAENIAKAELVQKQKEAKTQKQESAQANAVWQFLGAKTGQLWLLDDDALRQQAKEANLSIEGDRNTLISRIVAEKKSKEGADSGSDSDSGGKRGGGQKRGRLLLENKSSTSLVVADKNGGKKPRKSGIRIENLPSNLHR